MQSGPLPAEIELNRALTILCWKRQIDNAATAEAEQNRFLLTNAQSGGLTERGQSIIAHTPAGRFGTPEDLVGTLLWLVSPASAFVTGVVVPIDGGFSAYSGV